MAVWSTARMRLAAESDRLDAEYFRPADLQRRRDLLAAGGREIREIADVLSGRATEYDEDGNVAVVRAGDLVAPLIYPACGRRFLRAWRTDQQVALCRGDVLISSIGMGSIGKISFVVEGTVLMTVPEVTVIRNAVVQPEFLFAYLASRAGQAQIEREITGATGQQHLRKWSVERLIIPRVPVNGGTRLARAVHEAYEAEVQSRHAYERAQRVMKSVLESEI